MVNTIIATEAFIPLLFVAAICWCYLNWDFNLVSIQTDNKKQKQSDYRPWGFQEVEAPRFLDSQHLKVVRLSALRTSHLYSQEIFLVLISIRGWVDPRTIARLKGLCQWKIPMTPSGIKPTAFQLVVECLNQLRHRVDRQYLTKTTQKYKIYRLLGVLWKALSLHLCTVIAVHN
jgi:hypothetical protein